MLNESYKQIKELEPTQISHLNAMSRRKVGGGYPTYRVSA